MSTALQTHRVSSFFAATVIVLLATGVSLGQDLKPSIRWNVDAEGDWNTDANWILNGADPVEDGVPRAGEVAAVRNGGTAQITSAVPDVDDLGIRDGTVDIGQGGSLTVLGSTASGADGSLVIGGNGSITTGTLSNGGSLSISGPAATIDVQGSFESTGAITLNTTGEDPYSLINVAGTARLGGTMDLSSTPDGASLALGSSWPFLTAADVKGQPSQITIGGAVPSVARGLGLQVAIADGIASVAVENIPIAVINRTTGHIAIDNPLGSELDLKAYTLTSGNGLLASDAWNSLADQGAPGWSESTSNPNQLVELNLTGSTALTVGGSLDLGNGWSGTAVPPSQEDVVFNYALTDGRVLHGGVEFTGELNDLVLNINAESGEAILQNTSTTVGDFDIVGYNILSDSGSLNFSEFVGLGEEGWSKTNATEIGLGEISFAASKLFSTGTAVSLGNIFALGGTEDLRLEFGTTDLALRSGSVIYSGGASDPLDCNGDTTVDINDTLCATAATIDATLAAAGLIAGDLDGNGSVEFADFLALSANFGLPGTYMQGDTNLSGTVDFPDFLVLSGNFGQSSQAAAVPEPAAVTLAFLGLLGLLKLRKRAVSLCLILVAVGLVTTATQPVSAVDFDTRFIRLHPDAPNTRANSVGEAIGILNGSVIDIIKNDDITGKLDIVDLAGGPGTFTTDNAYLNDVNDGTMNDFLQYVSGTLTFPEGNYTIGFGRDDGGLLNMPNISFIDTYAERGNSLAGDGQIQWDATGGHQWTLGTFEVPEGGITTPFEAFFYEHGGGDSFEVAIGDVHPDPDIDDMTTNNGRTLFVTEVMVELEDGALGVSVTGDPFIGLDPSDFNSDGVIDSTDFDILSSNMLGTGAGDLDNNGLVDLNDFIEFSEAFAAPAGALALNVPEPTSVSLLLFAAVLLTGIRRVRR